MRSVNRHHFKFIIYTVLSMTEQVLSSLNSQPLKIRSQASTIKLRKQAVVSVWVNRSSNCFGLKPYLERGCNSQMHEKAYLSNHVHWSKTCRYASVRRSSRRSEHRILRSFYILIRDDSVSKQFPTHLSYPEFQQVAYWQLGKLVTMHFSQ